MKNDDWNRIKEIVDEAIHRGPQERPAFLNEACGGNDSIRREVESLLSSFEKAGGFMEAPVVTTGIEETKILIKGQMLGHYEILRELGEGGMGEVYLARDTKLGRPVAIKLLNKKYEHNEDNIRRFVREAKAASALNHPNILTIFEIGEFEGAYYIVSEYIEGETLRDILRENKLDLANIIDVTCQAASALAAAHKARIIHRDIKPENIILREDGYVKIVDFGLAKLLPDGELQLLNDDVTRRQNTTASGVILGTVNYMSPEQAKGKKVDERTDIFSLGVVLYEMITGKVPFAGDSIPETFVRLIEHEPEPIHSLVFGVPDEMQQVVSRMLEKDPGDRYACADELLSDLSVLRTDDTFRHRIHPSGQATLRDASTHVMAHSSRPVHIETNSQVAGESENGVDKSTEREGLADTVYAANVCPTEQTSNASRPAGGRPMLRARPVLLAAVILGVASIVGLVAWSIYRQNGGWSQKTSTVAVLPFKPIDAGSRDESLEMGVAETLITRLGGIRQITVRPLNSVRKFAESDADPVAAGQESKADAVLTGSLQKAGDRLRVNVRLVDVKTGNTLWSDKFDETFTDIFKVQDAIAERTANALRLTLSASERERLARRYTDNPEAYQLYLQGRNLYHRRLGNWSDQSMDFYNRALEKDPNFALAHVALADVLVSRHFTTKISFDEMMPQVKQHLAKAFALDDALAEAHSLSGAVKYQYEYDWSGAEKDFHRAIELDPGSSQVRLDYIFFLLGLGRFDEAFAQLDKAEEIEPDSLTIRAVRGNLLWHARRDDEAIKYLEDFTKVVPDRGATYFTLADLYRKKGRDTESIEAFLRGLQLRGRPQEEINSVAVAYRQDGWKGVSRAQIANFMERSRTERIRTMDFVSTYAYGGDKDNALRYLKKAIDEHDPLVAQMKVSPLEDPLRDDPRFVQLLQRINLQP